MRTAAPDPGMVNEPGKTSGYEVAKESTSYVPEFVEAAFLRGQHRGCVCPYLSTYGLHIVKYIGDVVRAPSP